MNLESLWDDLRYAIRGLRTKPGFAIAVVTTLALGIGANAAMFGIVDRLMFRPPPLLKDPDTAHRVYLFQTFRGKERASGGGQYVRFKDVDSLTHSFEHVAGYTQRDLAVGVRVGAAHEAATDQADVQRFHKGVLLRVMFGNGASGASRKRGRPPIPEFRD
jgi:hypothetical protein